MVTEENIRRFSEQCANIFRQVERDVIGQKEVVEGTIIAMIAGGNVLLEGVPGVGKPVSCVPWAAYSIFPFRGCSLPPI